MKERIGQLLARFDELERLLAEPDAFADQKRYRALTQEHAYLSEVKNAFEVFDKASKTLADNVELLEGESDTEMQALLEEEIATLEAQVPQLEAKLQALLVPPDPNDSRNIILELRAGTGGDEAALFVGDCVRMYELYAAERGWKTEPLAASPSEVGGFREYIMSLSGTNVYRFMKYEGGTHRVQRVPETETQGRIHTSAITVAVLLEPDEEEDIPVDEADLRVDTFRSSGAGGQHVNTTDSAVRLTHIPTGIVVSCQQERSQHKNKEKAMRFLKAKLAENERMKRQAEAASMRASQVGTGDRSERIRTYNFPQNRVTDHRINLTLYSLDRVMHGELEEISDALVKHFYEKKLSGNT